MLDRVVDVTFGSRIVNPCGTGMRILAQEPTMPTIDRLPEAQRADLVMRLKKIEGQSRGIQKMIEDGRDCVAVLDQMSSVKSAMNSLTGEMLESFALHCLNHPEDYPSPDRAVEQMVKTLVRHAR